MINRRRWWEGSFYSRKHLTLSRRFTKYLKPKDIKGSRLIVEAKSVGEIKRVLKSATGIKKIRSYFGNKIEIIHTNNKNNCYQMMRILREANIKIIG